MNAIQLGLAISASLLLCSIAGCTWVPLTPTGESVQVTRSSANIAGCERVGSVTAQTRSRVGIFARGEKKILEELKTLARNDAAEMGADHVVAEGWDEKEIDVFATFYSKRVTNILTYNRGMFCNLNFDSNLWYYDSDTDVAKVPEYI